MDGVGQRVIDDAVGAALSRVYDPCSVAAGRPQSLIDMRLVTGWTYADGVLDVTFCVTFPGCTMAPHFTEAARVELLKIDGVREVRVTVDTSHIWEPQPLAPLTGKPQAWRKRAA